MTAYHKLVRDKIPHLIEKAGEKPNVRILDGEEYIHCLEQKLDEETGEYHRDPSMEELADILEVVFALAEATGGSKQELMEVYQRKHDARGGFRDRVFLVSKE